MLFFYEFFDYTIYELFVRSNVSVRAKAVKTSLWESRIITL